MKKGVIILLIVAVTLALSTGVYFSTTKSKLKQMQLTDASISYATTLINLYRGVDNIQDLKTKDNGKITEEAYKALEGFNVMLKEQDEVAFNLTEFYKEHGFEDIVDPIYEAMLEEGVEELILTAEDLEGEYLISDQDYSFERPEDDKRVFSKEGEDYIKVKEMDFSGTGNDVVTYKGHHLLINKSYVPETYEMLIKNPDNIFEYTTHKEYKEKERSFIEVLYDSVNSGKSKIVRVINDGDNIIGFEVR